MIFPLLYYDMPELKTPTSTPTATGPTGNGNGDYIRTLNGVNYALNSLKEIYDVRLDGMDKAISVAHEDLVRVPTEVDKAVTSLDRVIHEKFSTMDERFSSIQKQFAERDTHMIEKSEMTQKALEAALASATKQIDSIGVQLKTSESNLNDRNTNTSAQIARIDNLIVAMTAAGSSRKEVRDDIWSKLVGAAAIGGGIVALIQFIVTRSS